MVIGITGGIGSGKTTFAKILNNEIENSILLLTDDIAKEQQKIGNVSYKQIINHFGTSILNSDNTINSKKLGEIVFSDKEKLEILNKITHPQVIVYIDKIIKDNPNKIILIESAILFECDLPKLCDEIIIVKSSIENRKEWLINNRGYSLKKIDSIITKQKDYTSKASIIIENNGTLDDLKEKCKNLKTNIEKRLSQI